MKRVAWMMVLLIFGVSEMALCQVVQPQRFVGVYEPSAVVQLSDGLVLIAEDEEDNPLSLFSIQSRGDNLKLIRQDKKVAMELPLDDLEGGTTGKNEKLFLITSHSTTGSGKKNKKRERLVRFGIVGHSIQGLQSYGSLRTDIVKAWTRLAPNQQLDLKKLNIEALAFQEGLNKLFIGLRSPLIGKKSNLLLLENPYAIFNNTGVAARFERLISLDLGGGGIRAMTFDELERRYLLANEVLDKKDKLRPAVWEWSGKAADDPVRVSLPKIKGIKNIEGMTFVTSGNRRYLLIVCDDGNRKKKKGAHYVFLSSHEYNISAQR